MQSQAKNILELILDEIPFKVIQEYRFDKIRRFRFDYYIKLDNNKSLAIEFEGGAWSKGRHTRPKGYINDCTKYNLATSLNIPVLRYTSEHLNDPDKVKKEILFTIENIEK